MTVHGHVIPSLLLNLLAQGRLKRERGSWPLLVEKDHYGFRLETDLGFVYPSIEIIEQETAKLPQGFPLETVDDSDDFAEEPGFIPCITDFSAIVEFAIAADGAPFCLDYRENHSAPSVIYWDDTYWRRLAPTFEDFISLFDLSPPDSTHRI